MSRKQTDIMVDVERGTKMKVRFLITALLVITLINSSLLLPFEVNAASSVNRGSAAIAAGQFNSFVIQPDGSLWSWGFSVSGMLGDGSTDTRVVPRKIMDDVAQVAASSHAMVIRTDGTLWAWGNNWSGQLGDGTTQERHTPVRVFDDVVQVSVGAWFTTAIRSDGSLWAWGDNEFGQLGTGTVMDRHTPVRIMENVAQVSAGAAHTMALRTDGSLYAWGMNNAGQLGVQTDTGMWDANSTPIRVMENVVHVSAGRQHTMAIRTDGSLYSWGNNWTGQLGDGTTTRRHTPARIMSNVAYVSAAGGGDFTVAIATNGNVYAWGGNERGQVGDGTTADWNAPPDRLTPVRIMSDVISVSAGGHHTLAKRSDGSVWGWGENAVGQLGDGTRTNRNSPILIMHAPTTPTAPPTISSTLTVSPTPSTVFVNGVPTRFEAYLIDGNNFFMLRDLAYALNGTEKQFDIRWDAATESVRIHSNTPYTPVGGEMQLSGDGARQATPNRDIRISKDGTSVSITAYLIGGNNFVRLRDVMRLLDVGVFWDGAANAIRIDTSQSYTG